MMIHKTYLTPKGTIHYWTNEFVHGRKNLVFLPGLSADHRLFDKQIKVFEKDYNVLVWDAPAHAESRPFKLSFSIKDKATWLHEILLVENFTSPILIGQSMGGYVSQSFIQHFPGEAAGFISIDSSPLALKYHSKATLWLLKRLTPIYKMYPWKTLVKQGAEGCAETEYGIKLMSDIKLVYDKQYYCNLVGYGYKTLAEAIELDLPYTIDCPCILICGEKDKAGTTKSYNKRWHKETGLRLEWIANSGHNSNTDDYNRVNELIREFLLS